MVLHLSSQTWELAAVPAGNIPTVVDVFAHALQHDAALWIFTDRDNFVCEIVFVGAM